MDKQKRIQELKAMRWDSFHAAVLDLFWARYDRIHGDTEAWEDDMRSAHEHLWQVRHLDNRISALKSRISAA